MQGGIENKLLNLLKVFYNLDRGLTDENFFYAPYIVCAI